MLLPEIFAELLATGRQMLQRAAAERGLTQPALLPPAVQDACASEAIATYNQTLFYRADQADSQPYPTTPTGRQLLLAYLTGYGPIDDLLTIDNLEDLFIQGHATIIARFGHTSDPSAPPPGKRLLPGCFRSDAHLVETFRSHLETVGAVWDLSHRLCDTVLSNGVRFHGVLPRPGSNRPVVVHLRRHRALALTVADLIARGTLSQPMATFLTSAVQAGLSILIAGAPSSGKTTTMDTLLGVITDLEEHLVIIEAEPELAVADPSFRDLVPHVTAHLTSGATADSPLAITQRDLVRAAHREAPTRVIVGELRGAEAYDWLQALNLGAAGSLSTIHANSCREALTKLQTYVMLAGEELPPAQIVEMIATTLNLVLYQERDRRTGIRRIIEIAEIDGYGGGTTTSLTPIFQWQAARQEYGWTGLAPRCAAHLAALDLPLGIAALADPLAAN